MIAGLYERVLTILVTHPDPIFYYSNMVTRYVIYGLCHHLPLYCNSFSIEPNTIEPTLHYLKCIFLQETNK